MNRFQTMWDLKDQHRFGLPGNVRRRGVGGAAGTQGRPVRVGSCVAVLVGFLVSAAATGWAAASGFLEPTLRGAWPGVATGPAVSVTAAGNQAILGLAGGGAWVYDLSDPRRPRRTGILVEGAPVRGVAMSGDRAVLAVSSEGMGKGPWRPGLTLVDLARPDDPRVLGTLEQGWGVTAVAASETHAFVADFLSSTVRIFQIAGLTAPKEVASLETRARVSGMARDGDHLYLVRQPIAVPGLPPPPLVGGTLRILDITHPGDPRPIADFHGDGSATGVTVVRNANASFACIANGTGLELVDVTRADAPRLLGRLGLPGAARVAAAGAGFVCATDDAQLWIIDVRDPAQPRALSSLRTGRACWGMTVVGDRALLALAEGGWQVLDLGDPARPTLLASEHTGRDTVRVAAVDRRVYLANLDIGLEAIDATAAGSPVFLGADEHSVPGVSCVAVEGSRLCAGRGADLLVYDLSPEGVPTRMGLWQGSMAIDDIRISGDRAYLAAQGAGLVVLSLADPAHPREIGSLRTGRIAHRLVMSGTRAYLSAWSLGGSLTDALEILDIAEPSAPKLLGTYKLAPYAGSVALAGTNVLVTEGGWTDSRDLWHPTHLHVVDVSVPGAPRRLSEVEVGGAAHGMVVLGQRLYLCTRPAHFRENDPEAGLHVWDLGQPGAPVRLGRYPIPDDNFADLALAGDLLAVANSWNGVVLLDPHGSSALSLRMARTRDGVRLEWPVEAIGSEVETTETPGSGGWRRLEGYGATNVAPIPAVGGRGFYRLRR